MSTENLTTEAYIEQYLKTQQKVMAQLNPEHLARATAAVRDAWGNNKQIFVIGNGGSAANASHFATDMALMAQRTCCRCKVHNLAADVSRLTALSNDHGYKNVFLNQLNNLAEPNDLLISLSVSGSSPNCAAVIKFALKRGVSVVSLVGANAPQHRDGRLEIRIPDSHYGRVEDIQMTILHMICYSFIER
jgi:D-sedoheptulose 7-phosphate isomerase